MERPFRKGPFQSLDLSQRTLWAHLGVILFVSGAYESLFIHHGIAWLFDEGWPLYAAKQLHEGGVLYRDVFFPFPPGHLLPAWIAYALDPPGIIFARTIYAGFSLALSLALYLLGRRLMPARFALLGALLLAIAAPRSHLAHLLFGYRFLVFSVLALLAFSAYQAYQRTRNGRALVVAGVLTGVALYFRLTPAFAVACAIGVAITATSREPRSWLQGWLRYGAGVLVVVIPLALYLHSTVGLDAVWREVVVRIIGLQQLQSKPIPAFVTAGDVTRVSIYQNFVPIQYWGFMLMYGGYLIALAGKWRQSIRDRSEFPHALLLAVVIWGAIYLLRTLGRSDEHHLTSALPPACLLIAHATHLAFARVSRAALQVRLRGRLGETVLIVGVLASWIFLQGSDLYLSASLRGVHPIPALGEEVYIADSKLAARLGQKIEAIRRLTRPGDTVLDLSNAPLLHAVTGRNGPGYIDVITPGVFMNQDEERRLIARLDAKPPAVVIWPEHDFDWMPSRSIRVTAPLLTAWVREHYRPEQGRRSQILVPRL